VFERFSASGRSVVVAARADATRRRDHVIGTEHLLMGLGRVDGPARERLAAAGITVDIFETIRPAPQNTRSRATARCWRHSGSTSIG
jgi:hypothetical protein